MQQLDATLFSEEIRGPFDSLKGHTNEMDFSIFWSKSLRRHRSLAQLTVAFSILDSNLRRSFEIESLLPTINDEGSRRSAYWITGGSFKFEVSLFNPTRMPFLQEVETVQGADNKLGQFLRQDI